MRRTSAWYLAASLALIIPIVMCLDYTWTENVPEDMHANPWNNYLTQGWQFINFAVLPFTIILVCSVLSQLEYRNHTWRQVLVSPQSKLHIWLTKFASVLMFVLLFLFCSTFFLAVTPLIIDAWTDTYNFHKHTIPWNLLGGAIIKTFACCLGLTAFQFLLGMHFRVFVMPLIIGMLVWIAGVIAVSRGSLTGWEKWHPYMLPAYAMDSAHWHLSALCAVAFCIIFIAAGYINFCRRGVNEK